MDTTGGNVPHIDRAGVPAGNRVVIGGKVIERIDLFDRSSNLKHLEGTLQNVCIADNQRSAALENVVVRTTFSFRDLQNHFARFVAFLRKFKHFEIVAYSCKDF